MSKEQVLTNARIVLEDSILDGSVLIRDGKIADISEGTVASGEDFEGDYLIPGLIKRTPTTSKPTTRRARACAG